MTALRAAARGFARPSSRLTAWGLPLGGFACAHRCWSWCGCGPSLAGRGRPPPAHRARGNNEEKTTRRRPRESPATLMRGRRLVGRLAVRCAALAFHFAACLWPAAAGPLACAAWLPACRLKTRVVGAYQVAGMLMLGLVCLQPCARTGAYQPPCTIRTGVNVMSTRFWPCSP
jgi:hypothetical protein